MSAENLPENAIHIKDLKKEYKNPDGKGTFLALDSISVTIPRGSIFGLLGPNGAGKSTFINILAGLAIKTSGEAIIWGNDIDKHPKASRSSLGVVPQELTIDPFFSPRKLLELQAGLYGVKKKDRITDTILKLVSLEKQANSYARSLSGGMKRRLMVARALVNRPKLLLLDEPTAGLDVTSARIVRKLVQKLKDEGGTVIYSTHHLAEAEQVCDRIIIVHNGTIRADGTPDELLQITETKSLEEAYVKLTSEVARPRQEDKINPSKFALLWRRLFTRKYDFEVNEDE